MACQDEGELAERREGRKAMVETPGSGLWNRQEREEGKKERGRKRADRPAGIQGTIC